MDTLAFALLAVGLIIGYLISKLGKSESSISSEVIRQQVGDAAREQMVAIKESLEASTEERLRTATQSIDTQARNANSSMEAIIKPLQDTLKSLDAKVIELENRRIEAYTNIQDQVKNTQDVLEALRGETTMLSGALRRSDTRGRWGELQLRRIIEMMSMSEHISFSEQIQQKGEGSW